MMDASVRDRRTSDTAFIDRMIYVDPSSDPPNWNVAAAVNIVGNPELMNNPEVCSKR